MIATGYNCGLVVGESRLRIVERHDVGGIEDFLAGSSTPQALIGVEGVVEDVQNDAYDTDRPTGYERVHVTIRPDGGLTPAMEFYRDNVYTDCITVDLGFCERL